jgi:peptidoglycan/xylan/chitin deacetylase (PgdA/CDA1 family)
MLNRALLERYRCPEKLAEFSLNGQLSAASGFFRFGSSVVCFGQSSAGSRSQDSLPAGLYDTCNDVKISDSQVGLPFDPNKIIDNLRFERYAIDHNLNGTQPLPRKALRFAYYSLRPFFTVPVRRHIQKMYLRGWEKRAFPHWPVDNTVEDILEECLALGMKAQGLTEIPFIWFWPDSAASCAVMTHDVETTLGRDFTSKLMDINDEYGIKASFQVVPEKRYEVPESYLSGMRDRGFEIAVQDLNHDGHLYSKRDEFLRRAELIRKYRKQYGATGFRAAILYRNLDWLPELDFSYDMSVPNVAHLDPQAGGCCTLFPYFIGKTLEIPVTTTQDYSLFHIIGEYNLDLWKKQASRIMGKHGLMNFIIHPDYIVDEKPQQTYRDLLAYLSQLRAEQNLWIPLPHEVDEWWRARGQMQLVQDGDTWRVAGVGSGRARVAYARLDAGKLSYSFDRKSASR